MVGLGVYALSGRTAEVAGWDVPVAQEHGGHEFVREAVYEAAPGSREVTVGLEAVDIPRLVTAAVTGSPAGSAAARTDVVLRVDGEDQIGLSSDGDPSFVSSEYVVQPGTAPTLAFRVARDDVDSLRLGIMLSNMVR